MLFSSCSNKYGNQEEERIMGKYEKEARELLNAIGGRENISAVSHCMTRMRFVLTD